MSTFDTLKQPCATPLQMADFVRAGSCREDQALDSTQALAKFLADVEKRAFQIARIAVRDSDEALDIVQDAMLQLARKYGGHPGAEWRPLFYRILNNRIRDWQRRRMVRNKFFSWLPRPRDDEEEAGDPYEFVADQARDPSEQLSLSEAMQTLEVALCELPERQRQAFCLRNFEGMDVAETAVAMGCSEGSVKTHYSRAVHSLRESLGDTW